MAFTVLEPKFINRNECVDTLSKKYGFSVFDFAQAKKESHLKELRNELVGKVNSSFSKFWILNIIYIEFEIS